MIHRNPFLYDCVQQYERIRSLADRAVAQVDDAQFFQDLGEDANSIATIVKHICGNMRSRWTDFLTTDGEKASRRRDEEFIILEADTRDRIMEDWDAGWTLVLDTLGSLTDDQLDSTILIRGEAHTVREAVLRQLNHYAYHVGQIVLIAKVASGHAWQTLSIPRGKSDDYTEAMRRGSERRA